MKKLFFICIASLVLIACGGLDSNVSFKEIDVNEQYRIKIPEYMKSTDMLNDDASLQYMNGFREAYTIVIDEPKDSFVQIFKEIGEYNDSLSTLENYKEVQLGSFKDFLEDFKQYDEDTIRFQNKTSYLSKVDGIMDGTKVSYFFRFVEGKEDLYMVMCWTEQWRKSTLENTFKEILLSLSEF